MTKDRRIARNWQHQLRDFFGPDFDLQVAVLDELPYAIDTPVVLLSHRTLREQAAHVIPPEAQVVVARRALALSRLPDLVRLPAGTCCLVVNNAIEPAEETCSQLRQAGIEHLLLLPYCPDDTPDPPRTEVAVTTGFPELVPPWVHTVIDLGPRLLDLSTLAELAVRLNLPLPEGRYTVPEHTREVTRLLHRQVELVRDLNLLRQRLQSILDNSSDAVVAAKPDGQVVAYNSRAQELFSRSPVDGILLQEVLPTVPTGEILDSSRPLRNRLFHIRGKDFLLSTSPVTVGEETEVVITFRDVGEVRQADRELRRGLRGRGFASKYVYEDMVGTSTAIRRALALASHLARTDLPVLLWGESGTGKEILAQAIHNDSPRRDGPFVPANLAALPEALLESELFGYEEGAFTGARRGGHPGLFEQAHGGTIFLDEVGEMAPGTQVKLLRVLQEREVMRLGGTGIIPVDVRVVAATNREPVSLVAEGKLRADLYYRLSASVIRLPPLRDRTEDIPLLVRHFLRKFAVPDLAIPPDLWERLSLYSWPGNVRQLENVVAVLAAVGDPEAIDWDALLQPLPTGVAGKADQELHSLVLQGNFEEFRIILEALRAARKAGQMWGRGRIALYAAQRGIPLTSERIRSRLRILSALGFVSPGRGRQGTVLTQKGAELLWRLESTPGDV